MIYEEGETSEIIMTAKKCMSKYANIFFLIFVLVVSDFWLLGIDRWGVNQIPLISLGRTCHLQGPCPAGVQNYNLVTD